MNHRVDGTIGFVSGMLIGAAIGAGIALLTAPQSGRRTRLQLRKAAGNLRDEAEDRWDQITHDVKGRVDEALRSARSRLS